MESQYKAKLKSIILDLRHILEGYYDNNGVWHPGDMEERLAALGVRRDRESLPLEQLSHLSEEDRRARLIVDAFIQSAPQSERSREESVGQFLQEASYTWANRLIALRCMEARGLIDEIIIQKESYGGRSLKHHRLTRQNPEVCAGEDDGLYAALFAEFVERAEELPLLFHPDEPVIALKPGVAALKKCIRLLSADDEIFTAPDALGWAYQYWNTEEKDRVFEKVRTVKGAKIEKGDIIPVTQLYTEPYMVKFLVQNSLGALWMAMHPASRLSESWEYYVRDADRAPIERKFLKQLSFLDPSVGSGHFLLEAFDLLFAMYMEEGELKTPGEICEAILSQNLFGIDIDERAIQIAACALYMKAKEKDPGFRPTRINLTATNIHIGADTDHLAAFLEKHPEDKPFQTSLQLIFESLQHADELGTLLQIEEPVEKEFRFLKALDDEDKAGPPKQKALFAEMDKPEQAPLPIGIPSYEEWKAGLLDRLSAHFREEFASADFSSRFFGETAGKGLFLFDFLSRRYDVVATNPPYMGSKNMGPAVKRYVEDHFTIGKRDLYACFIIRCRELSKNNGIIGMVTQRGWLNQKHYKSLRQQLLKECQLNVIADLGSRAFGDVSGENVTVTCFTFSNCIPDETFRVSLLSAHKGRNNTEKQGILADNNSWHTTLGGNFNKLKLKQIICDLPDLLIEALHDDKTLREKAEAEAGLWTGDDARYVRWFWEIEKIGNGWCVLTKGGGYKKWCGLVQHVVFWGNDGASIKTTVCSKFPYLKDKWEWVVKNSESYFLPGLTYSFSASASLGIRNQSEGRIFSELSPFIKVGDKNKHAVCGALNSRAYTALIRVLADKMRLRADYVNELPSIPDAITNDPKFRLLVLRCMDLAERRVQADILEYEYGGTGGHTQDLAVDYAEDALRLFIEGIIDTSVNEALNLAIKDVVWLYGELTTPAGCLRLIHSYDALPSLPQDLPDIPQEVLDILSYQERQSFDSEKLMSLRQRLRALYEAGPGAKEETDDAADSDASDDHGEEEEGDQVAVGARIPIPAETFLEELSQKLEVHPISVYWLLKESIEKEGWRCLPEEQRLTKDRFTALILRLLGHRWPKQIEEEEALPEWSDDDGIIPMMEGTEESTLYQHLRARIAADYGDDQVSAQENVFAEVMGNPLQEWVRKDFFRHHISQFKKRPIAWHLSSAKWASHPRQDAAFECLVYCHKTDGDLLPKLKNQYVIPLIKRLATELRGLENANGSLTGEQEARKSLLSERIQELKAFDAVLTDVGASGFGPVPLQPQLRQCAINDAMLCLKARWLKKLSNVIQEGPLTDWRRQADETGLHAEFSTWIMDALTHLDYHCAVVGPKPPLEKTLDNDPTVKELTGMICAESEAITTGAMKYACLVWWKSFDTTILKPISEKIRDAKKEQQSLKERSLDPKVDPKEQLALNRKMNALKSDVKAWQQELALKSGQGQAVRDVIESWSCPEAHTWEAWLTQQAMYDQLSSLNGKRPPLYTVAEFIRQESLYQPDINDGVRVNIAPLQKAGLLTVDVLAGKDVDKAIADRAAWRNDERRWCREGKLPKPGWWE